MTNQIVIEMRPRNEHISTLNIKSTVCHDVQITALLVTFDFGHVFQHARLSLSLSALYFGSF